MGGWKVYHFVGLLFLFSIPVSIFYSPLILQLLWIPAWIYERRRPKKGGGDITIGAPLLILILATFIVGMSRFMYPPKKPLLLRRLDPTPPPARPRAPMR
uniref:Uncharacterized protein n=1 Tax=viral metagenome TaxID=1070528 RepID=A0A6C0FD02_9ZZZZ